MKINLPALIISVLGFIPAGGSAVATPLPTPRAKSVIQVWLWGGPPHLDTFDPKPGAGRDYCGPFDREIATSVPEIKLNAMLPLLAGHADKFSLIRSMTHGINSHETAAYVMQTGREPGRDVFPCIGAVVSLFKGYGSGYDKPVPPYIVLTRPQGRFSESGFLGVRYKPFATGGDPNLPVFSVDGIVAENITDSRQRDRRELLRALDTLGRAMSDYPQFKLFNQCEDEAYSLMFGEVKKLFDLSSEQEYIRNQYGRNTFGQSCLMARRLVEYGVPYVTINFNGWDTHKNHFAAMNRMLPQLDQGLAALLQDLSERGLLDSTIVWVCGEFGASPKIAWEPPWNGGRHHFGDCFSVLVAGGGFKSGRVVGASDATGSSVVARPVYPADLLRSIYLLLGIDPDGPLPNDKGIEAKVLPAPPKGEGVLKELF